MPIDKNGIKNKLNLLKERFSDCIDVLDLMEKYLDSLKNNVIFEDLDHFIICSVDYQTVDNNLINQHLKILNYDRIEQRIKNSKLLSQIQRNLNILDL